MDKYLSPLVCCIECREVKSVKGLFTHLQRKHGTEEEKSKYSSGYNGKYDVIAERAKHRKHLRECEYLKNPKLCTQCNSILPFESRHNKFCSRSCSATYSNSKRDKSTFLKISKANKGQVPWNKGKSYHNGHLTLVCKISFCVVCGNVVQGKIKKTCSIECRNKLISMKTKSNPNCGGKRNSHRIKRVDSFGKEVTLESSYEVALANILDDLGINWIRPGILWYHNERGIRSRYHPDFLLVDHGIYLDPKNDYLIEQDRYKISQVIKENNVKVFIVSENNLNPNWIKLLLETEGIEPY